MRLPPAIERFLPISIRRILRLWEIFKVFVKHIFGFLADQWQISALARRRRREGITEEEAIYYPTVYERLRVALEDLGPTFVKLGQILSTRGDILSRELIAELSKLQEEASAFSYEEAKEQIYHQLGAQVEDIFSTFEKVPIAAASIGQVHYGVLKSGEEVIIKVQRPDIRPRIEADISIMMWIAKKAEKYTSWAKTYNFVERVREFGRFIREEMDYTTESRYCDTFRANFEGYEAVYIPKIYWEYTNPYIMVMEYVTGIRIREHEKLDRAGLSKLEIAKTIGRAYAKMILEDGFFHADPHPGNIFVQDEHHFTLIDFGMVGRLDKETKGYVCHYFLALVNQDAPALTEVLFRMYTIPRDVDRVALRRDVGRLLSKYAGVPLGQVSIVEIVSELMAIALKYNIIVPGEFTLFDKTFITLDGIGKQLAPEFDLLSEAMPFAQKFIRDQFSLKEMSPALVKDAFELKDALFNFPRQINKIVRDLESGELQVKFKQDEFSKEMQKLQGKMDRTASRLSLSVVIGALVIGASLMALRGGQPPIFWGLNAPQICFLIAGICGFWIIISSWWGRK